MLSSEFFFYKNVLTKKWLKLIKNFDMEDMESSYSESDERDIEKVTHALRI